MRIFRETVFSPLRAGCALKFLHTLEIDQGYLAQTPMGWGPPQKKNFNRENLKFGLKFSIYASISSELIGISSQIFIQTTCREPGVITCVQFMEDLPPKIWKRKKLPKFFAISDNFRLWSRISAERIHKSKIEKAVHQLRPLRRRAKKSFWTLVHKRKSHWREYWPTKVHGFRETVFPLLGGSAPWNFDALEIDKGYLVHTPTGTGIPPKIILGVKILSLA